MIWKAAVLALAALVLLLGCSSPKPPPAWPQGTSRPINDVMPMRVLP